MIAPRSPSKRRRYRANNTEIYLAAPLPIGRHACVYCHDDHIGRFVYDNGGYYCGINCAELHAKFLRDIKEGSQNIPRENDMQVMVQEEKKSSQEERKL